MRKLLLYGALAGILFFLMGISYSSEIAITLGIGGILLGTGFAQYPPRGELKLSLASRASLNLVPLAFALLLAGVMGRLLEVSRERLIPFQLFVLLAAFSSSSWGFAVGRKTGRAE